MTDGTISTIVGLVVGVSAASVSAVVVSRTRDRRRRIAEDESVALRDARLRAELARLDLRARHLREEIAELEGRRSDVVGTLAATVQGGDPSTALAQGALRWAHADPCTELARRLERAGGAHIIPFPFLASERD